MSFEPVSPSPNNRTPLASVVARDNNQNSNAIANLNARLVDLAERATDLREYLPDGWVSGDDATTALQAALTDMETSDKRTLVLGGGEYGVTETLQVNVRGVTIIGQQRDRTASAASRLVYDGSGAAIQVGTDDGQAHDANNLDGLQGFTLRDLSLVYDGALTGLDNGQQSYGAGTHGVREWRGGDVLLERVTIEHFDFAFWAIQSDLSHFNDLQVLYCHRGVYLGPRSSQATFWGGYAVLNDQAVHLDRCSNTRFYHTKFVGNGAVGTNPIRVASDWASAGTHDTLFDACQFEHLQGVAEIEAFVDFGVGGSARCRDLTFRDCAVWTEGSGGAHHAKHLVKVEDATRVYIQRLHGPMSQNLTKPVLISSAAPSAPELDIELSPEFSATVPPFDKEGSVGAVCRRQLPASGTTSGGEAWFQAQPTVLQVNHADSDRIMLRLDGRDADMAGATRWDVRIDRANNRLIVRPIVNGLFRVMNAAGTLSVLTVDTANNVVRLTPLATASRPSAVNAGSGGMIYDTDLAQPLWSDGSVWRDAMGGAV